MPVARLVQRGLLLLSFIACLAAATLTAAPASAQPSGGETQPEKPSWWLHKDISTHGHEIDILFDIILWMTMIVGTIVFIVMATFLVKYRYNPNRTATYIHGNNRLEIAWTLIPALLMAITAAISQSTWAKIKNPPVGDKPGDWPTPELMVKQVKAGEVVHIGIVAQQFNWSFHYPGKDGKLGKRRIELIKKGTLEEGIGLDRSDPDAKDDFVAGMLVVPVGKKIYFQLTSVDVLHSLNLPNFRIKQDAVPGLDGKVWLQATRTSADVIGKVAVEDARGEVKNIFGFSKPFDIVCAELCGAQHWAMRGPLYVVTQEQFDRYIAEKQKAIAPAGGGDEY